MGSRVCFILQVQAGKVAEYRQRHEAVWPEMREALTSSGWRNYSLFLRPDGLLVGYLECDDFAAALAAMDATDVNRRWQEEMKELFGDPTGRPPDQLMQPVEEIFHLP